MIVRALLALAGLAVLVAAVRWVVGLHMSWRAALAELAAYQERRDRASVNAAPTDLDAWLRHRRTTDRTDDR